MLFCRLPHLRMRRGSHSGVSQLGQTGVDWWRPTSPVCHFPSALRQRSSRRRAVSLPTVLPLIHGHVAVVNERIGDPSLFSIGASGALSLRESFCDSATTIEKSSQSKEKMTDAPASTCRNTAVASFCGRARTHHHVAVHQISIAIGYCSHSAS